MLNHIYGFVKTFASKGAGKDGLLSETEPGPLGLAAATGTAETRGGE